MVTTGRSGPGRTEGDHGDGQRREEDTPSVGLGHVDGEGPARRSTRTRPKRKTSGAGGRRDTPRPSFRYNFFGKAMRGTNYGDIAPVTEGAEPPGEDRRTSTRWSSRAGGPGLRRRRPPTMRSAPSTQIPGRTTWVPGPAPGEVGELGRPRGQQRRRLRRQRSVERTRSPGHERALDGAGPPMASAAGPPPICGPARPTNADGLAWCRAGGGKGQRPSASTVPTLADGRGREGSAGSHGRTAIRRPSVEDVRSDG